MRGCHFRSALMVAVTGAVVMALGASVLVAASADTITVGMAASGSQRVLHRGDLLAVRLSSNPSTGYAWRVSSGIGPVLRLVGQSYTAPRDGQRVGAPGTAVLRFRAVRVGQRVLRLAYTRSWEKGVEPARRFTLRVRVAC